MAKPLGIKENDREQMKIIPYGHQTIDDTDIAEVAEALRSEFITQGPRITEFEDALCKYTRSRYAVAVSSGTAALHIACLAASISRGEEVITSPITFIASANCVLYCGGNPVFADIQEETVNIDPKEVAKKITRKTRAVLPVHFAGFPCDMEAIVAVARKNGLVVIEDAAHALGARYKDSKIGSCRYSDMTTFSFHPLKGITTGEGGAVVTNDKKLHRKLLMLRNHGITRKGRRFMGKAVEKNGNWYYEMQCLGFNYRITDLQCALGISQLKKLDTFLERRREIAAFYTEKFSGTESILLPQESANTRSAWHLYYIRLKDSSRRRDVFDALRQNGIGAQVHYIPIYFHPFYKKLSGGRDHRCPIAERYYSQTITLPLYPSMTFAQAAYIVKTVKKVLQ